MSEEPKTAVEGKVRMLSMPATINKTSEKRDNFIPNTIQELWETGKGEP